MPNLTARKKILSGFDLHKFPPGEKKKLSRRWPELADHLLKVPEDLESIGKNKTEAGQ